MEVNVERPAEEDTESNTAQCFKRVTKGIGGMAVWLRKAALISLQAHTRLGYARDVQY